MAEAWTRWRQGMRPKGNRTHVGPAHEAAPAVDSGRVQGTGIRQFRTKAASHTAKAMQKAGMKRITPTLLAVATPTVGATGCAVAGLLAMAHTYDPDTQETSERPIQILDSDDTVSDGEMAEDNAKTYRLSMMMPSGMKRSRDDEDSVTVNAPYSIE